jgi:microcystin-dependent protein
MSSPFIGEIRMFGGNFAPAGWAFCNGALMSIAENDALFNLIGTTYGGDGVSTFGLPNLGGRIPVMSGAGFPIGEMAGTETVTLTTQQLPSHSHALLGSTNAADQTTPGGNVAAVLPVAQQTLPYGTDPPTAALDPTSVTPVGGSQPHDNMQPYLVVTFIISLFGIYPST